MHLVWKSLNLGIGDPGLGGLGSAAFQQVGVTDKQMTLSGPQFPLL